MCVFFCFFYHVNCRKVLLSLLQLMGFHDWPRNRYLFQRLISTDFTEVWWRAREWHCSVWSSKKATCHSEPSHGWDLSRNVTTNFEVQCFEETISGFVFLPGSSPKHKAWIWAMPAMHSWPRSLPSVTSGPALAKGSPSGDGSMADAMKFLGWKCWEYLVELIMSIDDDVHWHIYIYTVYCICFQYTCICRYIMCLYDLAWSHHLFWVCLTWIFDLNLFEEIRSCTVSCTTSFTWRPRPWNDTGWWL